MAPVQCFLLCIVFFTWASANVQNANAVIRVTDNPADKLVDALNKNRTAKKLPSLYSNPGLACIALQYIKAYQGDCKSVGGEGSEAKKPADSEFNETFAPNCSVKVNTLAHITGRFIACQSEYVDSPYAFSHILIGKQKSFDILYSKNHTEVGAAVSGTDRGGPYFWCVLFSNGKSNQSFVLDGGVAKLTKPGCFSGANDVCSEAYSLSQTFLHPWLVAGGALLALFYAFGSG
ncbi:unnamed protein product [Cuscuta epithymum]|uniref:Ferredoxin-like protein n=1 Tax=Cuscuta epithymum TaxID=186058 RepID=A0AAV0D0X6_9ASTE|nr:unnamed protein product [Cuscuta epithymum]